MHLPAWRTQSTNYLSTGKKLNKNGYISLDYEMLCAGNPHFRRRPLFPPALPLLLHAIHPSHTQISSLSGARPSLSQTSHLFSLLAFGAVGPSALPCAGGFPPQRPPYTMPRWRRVAGMLSMPTVAHPRYAAKPSAVTTVGAGLVPAHSHPQIGLHPRQSNRLPDPSPLHYTGSAFSGDRNSPMATW